MKQEPNHISNALISSWFFAIVFFHCSSPKDSQIPIVLPNTDIRLEFRGSIQNIPENLTQPYQLRARSYSCPDWDENYAPRIALKEYPGCMNTYVEKIQTFENTEYRMDLDVPTDWSHAYIELLGVESTKGKFSPGHNPNWFTYSKGEILTFQHDFSFRSQENPIPSKIQIELAEKFAPILVMARDKKIIPSNMEKYFGRVELGYSDSPKTKNGLLYTRYEPEKTPYMILPDPTDIPNYNKESDPIHIYYHIRYADTYVSGTQAESLPGYRDDRNYWYQRGDGRMVISYWFWYDYNYGPSPLGNFHQGDIESFSVLCDATGKPLRIMTTGHDNITLDTSWNNINSINNHPILYIASGRNSDGGNPTGAYGDHEVWLDAGSELLNKIADPKDIFPDPKKDIQLILPKDLRKENLTNVLIGASTELGDIVDWSKMPNRSINRLIEWEEPGWIGEKAYLDPDGHHNVSEESAEFLKFPGKIGKHPYSEISILKFGKYGISPKNAPFKINIEQHYTYERPRTDRTYSGRWGDYGPKFYGNSQTPQFLPRKSGK
jgi:hypothetical protein